MYAIFTNNGIAVNPRTKLGTRMGVHFKDVINRCKKSAKTIKNSELPSGMPWNIIGADEMKVIIQLFCNWF